MCHEVQCGWIKMCSQKNSQTSFLHEGKEVVQKLLPFWVIIQFIQL